jgi:hypothetical protein
MTVLSLFQWCESTAIGVAIRDSLWLFPIIEAVHLVALALVGGCILIVDLRLIGLGFTHRPASHLAQSLRGWFLGGLVTMVVTGCMLMSSEATKCYRSPAFWIKMIALGLAISFAATIRRRYVVDAPELSSTVRARLVGLTSLGLWLTVGIAGRWIGFS